MRSELQHSVRGTRSVYALALGAALLLGAPEPTHAVTTPRTLPFFDSLTIVPEAPFAGQAVGFTVRAGFCNAMLAPLGSL